ncbi:molybdate ABC transporter substrate-binding protein [Xylanimonas sp. McL0601]|uniref:molybdate ABC transporter substrate-binding protein n=1 Tax=Xylanimonas sp. McL0601 TaxID=3414739 RepID=UPI003CF8B8CB
MRKTAVVAAPVAAVLAIGLAIGLAGCAGVGPATGDAASGSTAPATLTVFAAASLKGVFQQLADQFEADHPGVTVQLSFAGSSDLVAQIQQGAPADVFASADTENMHKLVAEDLVAGDPVDFATNTLEIAVPPGNPAGIASFADLAKDGVNLVVCAPEVPCGRAAVKVEQAAGVTLSPVSEEQSVTDVLSKVIAGEADAGLVYVTDVKGAAGKVEGVTCPVADQAVNTYPIAPVAGAAQPELAQQFVGLVTGSVGQGVLSAAGFGRP